MLVRWGAAAAERYSRALHQAAETIAERQGGAAQHSGADLVVLVFGVPVAHEDDCLRATRAALELRDRAREIAAEIGDADMPGLRAGVDAGAVLPGKASE